MLRWLIKYDTTLNEVTEQTMIPPLDISSLLPIDKDSFLIKYQTIEIEDNTKIETLEGFKIIFTPEPPNPLLNLKKDIKHNFLLIEDVYHDLFLQHDQEYKYYDKVYPNGEISKEEWIKIKDKQLQELKEKKFQEIYEQYKNTNN